MTVEDYTCNSAKKWLGSCVPIFKANLRAISVNPFGEFKIQNSKFKMEDPTDESGGLNNVAGHFFLSMNKIQGLVSLCSSVILGMLAVPITLSTPAKALQVQVNPATPKLGNTISVIVSLDTPASGSNVTVTSGSETYPAYEIAPNQYRAMIPTTPLEKAGTRIIRVSGEGQVKNLSVQVSDRKFPVQRINLPPGKAGVKATDYELQRAAEFKAVRTPEKFWNGPFLAPNKGRVSTIYGVRRYYNGKFANDYYHRGVDYAGAAGSPVVAPAGGRVTLVGRVSQGFRVHGNVVGIDHGQGVASIFMHLSRINVKEGDFVKPGQLIGAVGATGASTGPHLHWGLYVNGKSVDPVPWRYQTVK